MQNGGNVHRVPHFIWLHEPKFFRASVLPDHIKNRAVDEIEKTLKETSSFFINYNKSHEYWSKQYLAVLLGHSKRTRGTPYQQSSF